MLKYALVIIQMTMLIFSDPPMTRGSEKIGDRERKSLEGIWVARLVVALNAGKKACSILNYLRKEKIVPDFIYQSSSQIIPNSFHLCLVDICILNTFQHHTWSLY